MNIIKQATYHSEDVQIVDRTFVFQGFVQVEKVNLRHRLFNQTEYTSVISRELIQRPEALWCLNL